MEESKGPVIFFFFSNSTRHTTANEKFWCIPQPPFSLSLSLSFSLCLFFWVIVFPSLLALCRETSDAPGRCGEKRAGSIGGWAGLLGGQARLAAFLLRGDPGSNLDSVLVSSGKAGKGDWEREERRRKESVKDKDDAQLTWVFHVDPTGLQVSERLAAKNVPRQQRPFVHQQAQGAGAEFCAGCFSLRTSLHRPWRPHDF